MRNHYQNSLYFFFYFLPLSCNPLISQMSNKDSIERKTNMMWPSQNFLLYNGTVIKIQVNEWINNLKKIYYVVPPLWGYISVQIITI